MNHNLILFMKDYSMDPLRHGALNLLYNLPTALPSTLAYYVSLSHSLSLSLSKDLSIAVSLSVCPTLYTLSSAFPIFVSHPLFPSLSLSTLHLSLSPPSLSSPSRCLSLTPSVALASLRYNVIGDAWMQ